MRITVRGLAMYFDALWETDREEKLAPFVQKEKCWRDHAMENIAEMQNSSRSSFYFRLLHSRAH